MTPDFSDHIMFCLSTGNQTVNLVPVLQFGIKRVKLFSTEYADNKGLTERLQKILEQRGIRVEKPVHISSREEKEISALVECLIAEALPHQKIVWNISGGQKIPTIALHTAYHNRSQAGFRDDHVLYLEARPPETWWFGSDNKMQTERSSCDITLDEVLYLNDSMSDEKTAIYPCRSPVTDKNLCIADKALSYYLEDDLFREAFFACMRPGFQPPATRQELTDTLRKSLNTVKAELSTISYDINKDYSDLLEKLSDVSRCSGQPKYPSKLQDAIGRVNLIHKPEEVYKSYWNEIRKRTVTYALSELTTDRVRLHAKSLSLCDYNQLKEQFESLGGEVRDAQDGSVMYRDKVTFSAFRGNAVLFEWMVAAAVMRAVEANQKLKDTVAEIHLQCLTKKAADSSALHDAELDLVITTRFGTLIILEVKTYDFSGDTAKGKDHSAYKKSGPYGKAIMVGPLIKAMMTRDASNADLYPPYIDGKIQVQKKTAQQNGISYSYLDEIGTLLERELSIL